MLTHYKLTNLSCATRTETGGYDVLCAYRHYRYQFEGKVKLKIKPIAII